MIELSETAGLEQIEKTDAVPQIDQQTAANLDASARRVTPVTITEEADGVADAEVVTVVPPKVTPEKQPAQPVVKDVAKPLAQKAVALSNAQEPKPSAPSPSQEVVAKDTPAVQPTEKAERPVAKPTPERAPTKDIERLAPKAAKDKPEVQEERRPVPTPSRPADTTPPVEPEAPNPKAGANDGGSGEPPAETLSAGGFSEDDKPKGEGAGPKERAESAETQPDEVDDIDLTPPKQTGAINELLNTDGHELRDRLRREHPPYDETNDRLMKERAESVTHTAPEEVIDRCKDLAASMEEVPFRSPTYLTCMYELAEQLKPYLAEYSTLVVSDTHSRLPALVFRRLINEARDTAGLSRVDIRFVNGLAGGNLQDYPEAAMVTPSEGRTLIFSDAIIGRPSLDIHAVLQQNAPDANVDVAGIGDYRGDSLWVKQQLGEAARVIVGNQSRAVPYLYSDIYTLNRGVEKRPGSLEQRRHQANMYDSEAVARARREAVRVAEHFSEMLGDLPMIPERVAKKGVLRRATKRLKRHSGGS